MKLRTMSQFLTLTMLVAALAACTGVQVPITGTPSTPVAAVEDATTETPEVAEDVATEELLEEPTEAVTDEAMGEVTEEAAEEVTGEPTEELTEESAVDVTAEVTDEATEEAVALQGDTAAPVAVEPLDAAACEAIQMAATEQLGVEFAMSEMDFVSELANRQGTACTLVAMGTGEDFGNFLDVAQTLRDIFEAEGWSENIDFLADGPTGTAFGYELDGQFAMTHVSWTPAEDAECPDDQPISACELEPSQQIFTVIVQLVQAS